MARIEVDPEMARLCSEQAWTRTTEITEVLSDLDEPQLTGPTLLPEWTRITIACHLRYGARASRRMTVEALDHKETTFYPGSRSIERPATLAPSEGENLADVVSSLRVESRRLRELWAGLSPGQWETEVQEPKTNPDLGGIPVGVLAVLRLTEVEVHGVDLDLHLPDWSDLLVSAALPVRLAMLATRRWNTDGVDPTLEGSWLLCVGGSEGEVGSTDGLSWLVTMKNGHVTSERADFDARADVAIQTSERNLFAMLLGRPRGRVAMTGDSDVARLFKRVFPGP
jgi:uncharacterized protein (TIGR03083 family)